MWLNCEHPMIVPEISYPVPHIEDEILMKKLHNQPRIKGILDIDITYIDISLRDKVNGKPIASYMMFVKN